MYLNISTARSLSPKGKLRLREVPSITHGQPFRKWHFDPILAQLTSLGCPNRAFSVGSGTWAVGPCAVYLHLQPSHSLKSSLQKTLLAGETVNLSGIPLSVRNMPHITCYLGSQGAGLTALDLSFTGLSDELLHLLLPSLWTLPRLSQLLLNGNRLTRAAARELTEAMKDTTKFPALAWVDLDNNVDVASLPQPLLVGLRRRLSQCTLLTTLYEGLDLEPEGSVAHATTAASTWGSAAAEPGSEPQACCTR